MPPKGRSTVSQATPQAPASNAGQIVPMDWDWIDENDGGPTYMSLAASSYHPGGVNALFADGSVRFIKNTIAPPPGLLWARSPAARSSRRISIDRGGWDASCPKWVERGRGDRLRPLIRYLNPNRTDSPPAIREPRS